ncbi:MAG TPA: hypothetical protein VF665_10180 [Longimicrobium sp.]|jgi:hypothetical protein|uniref:hypothetical protein n=1 Tax=Longimicrobium sp. TaxID=2029185 RepID=UPI002ED9F6B8
MTYAIALVLIAAILFWAAELTVRAMQAEHLFVLRLDNGKVRVLMFRSPSGRFEVARPLDVPVVLARFESQRITSRIRALRAQPARAPRRVQAAQAH